MDICTCDPNQERRKLFCHKPDEKPSRPSGGRLPTVRRRPGSWLATSTSAVVPPPPLVSVMTAATQHMSWSSALSHFLIISQELFICCIIFHLITSCGKPLPSSLFSSSFPAPCSPPRGGGHGVGRGKPSLLSCRCSVFPTWPPVLCWFLPPSLFTLAKPKLVCTSKVC